MFNEVKENYSEYSSLENSINEMKVIPFKYSELL
jgi:hypothetical protein